MSHCTINHITNFPAPYRSRRVGIHRNRQPRHRRFQTSFVSCVGKLTLMQAVFRRNGVTVHVNSANRRGSHSANARIKAAPFQSFPAAVAGQTVDALAAIELRNCHARCSARPKKVLSSYSDMAVLPDETVLCLFQNELINHMEVYKVSI
jgi:hypothetical protein